ncbi:hypothetical protein GCM10025864_09970 [Luteimicrobium album]|uniref:Activator of Hsp90 ATPase homologue 1/2-like C-terminal domain-containing protein n=1 Tax=Luteimicrobium album TaxID=1054550 RepID=A0ABQ6HZC8_9MICO|nr:hypothetical protein GCM10025864_09970 [Luteimicrobium album]
MDRTARARDGRRPLRRPYRRLLGLHPPRPAGREYGFRGTFHEVTPERLVQTFEFDGYPGHVALDTATLEALDGGRTRVTTHSVYQSVEDRDGMVASGMETGLTEGYERLDELLPTLAATSAR